MKLGRLPRVFRPEIPHYSALAMGASLPPPPETVDWTKGVNPNWGIMLNDRLGDCTCAAAYHAMQLWSTQGRKHELTEPDSKVLAMYEEFCGYNPANPNSDQGGVEQHVLTQWLNKGVPIIEGPNGRSHIKAFVEIDPRNHNDVKRAINDCGCAYIGFEVPNYLVSGPIPMVWDRSNGDQGIAGGHAVIVTGYTSSYLQVVSWGSGNYRMTWGFWDQWVDEVYGLAHPWWFETMGRTLLGMSLSQLESAMAAMRKA